MKKMSLVLVLTLIFIISGCGKKEAPPPPKQQVKVEKPEPVKPDTEAVKLEAEEEPVPEPEPKVKVRKVEALPGTYTIQVSAWETKDEALNLASFFEAKGYDARMEVADLDSGRWYRVRIGQYDGYESARSVADEIVEKYNSDIWLVRL